jgi:hypothetical protein
MSHSGPPPRPPAGLQAVLLAALVLGFVLLAIQLWLLTVALDRYLAGDGEDGWLLAVFSGLVFVGGLTALYVRRRLPIIR